MELIRISPNVTMAACVLNGDYLKQIALEQGITRPNSAPEPASATPTQDKLFDVAD